MTRNIGKNTVILGDCENELSLFSNGYFDVVVTSPPYNLNMPGYDDNKEESLYLWWLGNIIEKVYHKTKYEGSLFLNLGSKPSDPLFPFRVIDYLLAQTPSFQLQNVIHWIKSMSFDLENGEPVNGHVKPICSDRFLADAHEYIFHLSKTKKVKLQKATNGVGVKFKDKSNLKRNGRGKNGDCRDAGNVWLIPYQTINSKKDRGQHPSSFPVYLAKRCVMLHGVKEGMKVLDPFSGIFSTNVAATELDVECVGIEQNEEFFNWGCERLKKMEVKEQLKLSYE